MNQVGSTFRIRVTLHQPSVTSGDASWAFVILPKETSNRLPRRGRITVQGTLNGHRFQVMLEPDGQLSHWLRVSRELIEASGASVGETVTLEIAPVDEEPDPDVPADFLKALSAAPDAQRIWDGTTTLARLDWLHWVTSAKHPKTRVKRIHDACEMLAAGKKRVCCFDASGYYSKAFRAPDVAGVRASANALPKTAPRGAT